MRILLIVSLLCLSACMPATPPLQLAGDCDSRPSVDQLAAGLWLNGTGDWRLRQVALLEFGGRKLPLEGFLRLDLAQGVARLVAMNEMGVVLIELQVSADGEELLRAVPQLQRTKGLAQGIGGSLRQIFLTPRLEGTERLNPMRNGQRLVRKVEGGRLEFLFDCRNDLRETRYQGAGGDWRVLYSKYQEVAGARLPAQLILNDYRHRMKLSLWLKEAKVEP